MGKLLMSAAVIDVVISKKVVHPLKTCVILTHNLVMTSCFMCHSVIQLSQFSGFSKVFTNKNIYWNKRSKLLHSRLPNLTMEWRTWIPSIKFGSTPSPIRMLPDKFENSRSVDTRDCDFLENVVSTLKTLRIPRSMSSLTSCFVNSASSVVLC